MMLANSAGVRRSTLTSSPESRAIAFSIPELTAAFDLEGERNTTFPLWMYVRTAV